MTVTEIMLSICNFWSSFQDFVNWGVLKNFVNSAFVISLLGALTGAFAGATAAQRIAERNKHREELLREMRNTNAAIALSFGVCNTLIALKKQYVKELKEGYDIQKTALNEFHRKRDAGEVPKDLPFDFVADMRTLQPLALPLDTLRSIVFERLSIVGRPLNLVVTLFQTAENLEGSLAKRNSLIEGYKVEFGKDPQHLVPMYFGLPFGGGQVNLEYPETINAIHSQTDDGIFFGNLLCKDLHNHGIILTETFKKKFKIKPPQISEVDFGPVVAEGLMPEDKNYMDWINAFVKK